MELFLPPEPDLPRVVADLGPLAWVRPTHVLLLLAAVYLLPELLLARQARVAAAGWLDAGGPAAWSWLWGLLPGTRGVAAARGRRESVRALLDQAGLHGLSGEVVLARRLRGAVVGLVCGVLGSLLVPLDGLPALGLAAGLAWLGSRLPLAALRRRAAARRKAIFLGLPIFYQRVASHVATGVRLQVALRQVADDAALVERDDQPLYELVRQAVALAEHGKPFERALVDAARETGLQGLVDVLGLVARAEQATGSGIVELLHAAGAAAAEHIRLALEASRGRSVAQGAIIATVFEMPAMVLAAVVPTSVGGLLEAGLLPGWF